ncbi:hypothetical protein BDN72DRAFT_848007 [Pluteus cervinus]|uniref:Uncharacterized protein n=1 Tax=Pluteus cervinus TaxID=181527 RepID=A0ACD3ABV0_9AGAR|nr:hypothetical protein BDN72DRAFT_848007 [Pluteus cervinus]
MISADTQIKAEKSKEEAQNEADKDKLIQFDLGVWRIIMEKTPQNPAKAMNNVFNDARTILRLVKDVYQLGPWLFVIMVLTRTWHCLEPLVLLALSSRLLRIIEEGLRTGKPDAEEITKALLLRLITAAFVALLQKFASQCEMVLQGRVRMHFDAFILQQKLQLGLCGPEGDFTSIHRSSHSGSIYQSLK